MPVPPIIIVGMHRSGTTMITKMLENLGLFVGDQKEINNEALFFGTSIIGFLTSHFVEQFTL